MVVLGLGLGPSIPLYTLAIQNAVEPRDIGVATASASFFRQIGSTIGVTTLGAVFAVTLLDGVASVRPGPELAGITPVAMVAGEAAEGASPVRLRVDVPAWRAAVARARPPEEHARAFAAVDRLDRAQKHAFAESIRAIYVWGLALACLALLVTLFVPQLPLRKATARVPTSE